MNIWSGFLFGIGIAGFIDESIFHQLLHWHHFYDKSTTAVGLVSDGFFHAFSWFATIAGLFLYADLRRIYTCFLQGIFQHPHFYLLIQFIGDTVIDSGLLY